DLDRVDDPGLWQVDDLAAHDLVTPVRGLRLCLLAADLSQEDRPVLASVRNELPEGLLECAAEDVHAGLLVALGLDLVERLDRVDAGQDLILFAVALDERRVVLVRRDPACAAEILDRRRVELAAGLFGDDLAAGEGCDVLEHGLAAVAETRGLDPEDVQRAAELVHDERRERLAVDVL